MAWQKGPLPHGTYNWGGVVLKQADGKRYPEVGFFYADFLGDKVMVFDGKNGDSREVSGYDVLLYDNSLILPPDTQ